MAKGENIFKRKDGRWEARYIKGYELSGKIKYGYCYGKTYREAKEKVTKFKAVLINGTKLPDSTSRHRFAFYCDEWLMANRAKFKESTYIKYYSMIEKYIKPKLGGCFPLGFSDKLIENFQYQLLNENGLSPKYLKDILVLLHSILKYTAKCFPGIFPSIDIIYPKNPKKEMRVLSIDEQKNLAAYLMDDIDYCKFGVLLTLSTGIRIGELCALRWENISFKDATLSITSTMQRLKDLDETSKSKTKIVISTPKSDNSIRTIPLTDTLIRLCQQMCPENSSGYILTGTANYIEPRAMQYKFAKYIADCGITDVHFHSLRHTFATRCVEVGFEIKTLSEILGHSSVTITLERYVHSSMELKRNNMYKLEALGL